MNPLHSTRHRVAGSLLVLAHVATGAQHQALAAQDSFAMRDSAGVTIVMNGRPAWSDAPQWRIGSRPALRIGAVEGDPNHLFEQVRGATRMEDGTIVVLEGGTNELRLFGGDGNFVRNLGGTGEGPGEFRFLTETWVRGDTIFGFCNLQKRISVFGRGGEVLETVRVEVADGAGGPAAKGQFSDGTLVVLSAPSGGLAFTLGVIPGATWRVDRFARDGRFMNAIAPVPEPDRWGHDIPGLPSFPYLPLTLGLGPHAASEEHVYAGDPYNGSIERRGGDGELTRLIRWPAPEQRVTDRDRRRWRESRADPPRGFDPAGWRRYLNETPFPDRMPGHERLLVDALGNLWAKRFRPPWEEGPPSWYVFDGRGVWLGELPVPSGLRIFEIGTDYVLGLLRDELDVPFVVILPLARGE